MIDRNDKKLGELLVDSGYITGEQLDTALVKQKTSGKKLGKFLIEDGVINEEAAKKAENAGLLVVMDDCMLRQHQAMDNPNYAPHC